MPRRNQRKPRHRRLKATTASEQKAPTTDQMARQLVRRGLASELILGHTFRITQPEGTTAP